MHCNALARFWVVFPALVVSASAVVSRQESSAAAVSSVAGETGLQELHIDENSAQASFFVPCTDCIGNGINSSLPFHLEAYPTEQPCGASNVSLNGISLVQDWEATGVHGQGVARIDSSGHALSVFLRSDCLQGITDNETKTQLLTLTIETVDQNLVNTPAGFTLSFKQYPRPELLRLSLTPDYDSWLPSDSETWRDPPVHLRISPPATIEEAQPVSEAQGTELSLEEQLIELRQLEAQANELIALIQAKKDFINAQFPESAQGLKQEIDKCASFLCVVKAIGNRVHKAVHVAYLKFHDQPYTHWQSSAGGQAPTMLHHESITAPEAAVCHDSLPSERPPPYRGTISVTSNEKSPAINSTQPQPQPHREPEWKDAKDPSVVIIVLKFLFVFTGLAFIFALLRRCCISDRTRAERAAERERKATERLYKCAARRQSWRDWWHGRKRGKPGYRPGDYEEKRALILQQENLLEGAMQDEIRQLRIREEIRQLRQTTDAVDELVRAEEGRSSILPRYIAAGPSSRTAAHPFGFHPVPAPITIPSATSRVYPNSDYEEQPGTPLSRTSSLPDYKTDGSEPPGYESDRRSSFSSENAFSEYAHSIRTTDSAWSPESSIPDLSPRPSMETAFTSETARTFL